MGPTPPSSASTRKQREPPPGNPSGDATGPAGLMWDAANRKPTLLLRFLGWFLLR